MGADFFEINLFQITERNDLWFTENASSPLPESCLLEGLNNSILKCSTLQNDQLGGQTMEEIVLTFQRTSWPSKN